MSGELDGVLAPYDRDGAPDSAPVMTTVGVLRRARAANVGGQAFAAAVARGFYFVAEVAALFGLSENRVTERVKAGFYGEPDSIGGPWKEGGRRWAIPVDALARRAANAPDAEPVVPPAGGRSSSAPVSLVERRKQRQAVRDQRCA